MKKLGHIKYWFLRINWRMGTALVLWLLAPRFLDAEGAANLRDACVAAMVAALLAWANHNGNRQRTPMHRGSGVLGARSEDDKPK